MKPLSSQSLRLTDIESESQSTPCTAAVVDELESAFRNELPPQPHHAVSARSAAIGVTPCRRISGTRPRIRRRCYQDRTWRRGLVVDALEFGVAGHAVPGIAVHDAVLIVLGDGRVRTGHLLSQPYWET